MGIINRLVSIVSIVFFTTILLFHNTTILAFNNSHASQAALDILKEELS